MNPGGPTELAVNRRLGPHPKGPADRKGKSPIIVPPDVDAKMSIPRKRLDPRVDPYVDERGNPIVEGLNPDTRETISPHVKSQETKMNRALAVIGEKVIGLGRMRMALSPIGILVPATNLSLDPLAFPGVFDITIRYRP